ncbi:uncharacterized protein LOC118187187 isoform X2 [Stegodyphus dumicola]|nr:uncharacterized protein LOC118187187 isoform X2 [Stegodyphus dumicola]
MDPTPWSPYSQQPYSHLSSGSPHLPSSAPHEESLNNYGSGNSNPLLMSSCHQGITPLSSRTNIDPPPPPALPNSNYDALISPPAPNTKETTDFFSETLFNGVCKENQSGIRNFIQTQVSASRTEGNNFPASESITGYTGQVPSISFPPNIDRPSPGPFGVLPHEAVMTRPGRFERNNEKFISPVSKTASASYNNGPYTERDVTSIYSSAPLSAQSAFSGDNTSHSPAVNSVTSPTISNFSSPNEYYSSPKTNFGAYNSLQSPVPQSPSVAHSYPSSPFANVDPVSHIPSATPCSPMNGGTYVNNLNAVPQRNGQKAQHSPSNSGANNVMCYNTPQSQNMVHHGPQSVLSKTPDYHSDYVFAHDHNTPSYSSVYPPIHPGQMSSGNSARISPRTHSQHLNSMSHDSRMQYGHSAALSSASVTNPSYLQNKISHEAPYGACSSSIPPGQSMHPPRYPSCSSAMNTLRNNSIHPNPSMIPNHMGGDQQFGYPSADIDDKNALDIFNSHVDSGAHNHDSSISNFLENDDLKILDADTDMLTNRQLKPPEPDETRQNCSGSLDTPNRNVVPHPSVSNASQTNEISSVNMNYSYNSCREQPIRPGNLLFHSPRRRGRRGRRRKADSGNMCTRFQSFKNDRNVYNNGYPMPPSKILDYGNVDCYTAYPKRLCDQKELPPVNYPLSRYRSELKMNENQKKPLPVSKPVESIEQELAFLAELQFPDEGERDAPHTFMKTRNKDIDGFLQCYKNFLANRKVKPDSEVESGSPENNNKAKNDYINKEHKDHKHKSHRTLPKLIIKMGRCNNPGEWRLTESYPEKVSDSDGSASENSDVVLSSHKSKQDNCEKSRRLKLTGKLNKVSERFSKHSAKRKNDSVDHSDKYNDLRENHLHFTNSETLPAGKLKIKTEIDTSLQCDEQLPNMPKKRGRKAKKPPAVKTDAKKRKSSVKSPDPINNLAITIKQEIIEEVAFESSRRSSLRSRKNESTLKEVEAGPSIKKEPIELSDDEVDIIDDSDSDPAWTPSSKTPKATDHIKSHGIQSVVKKRGPKVGGRRSSAGNAPAAKRERKKSRESQPRKTSTEKSVPATVCKKEILEPVVRVRKEKERFLVAKADINEPTPFLWRVDKETNMLQRFEWFEQDGLLLYRSTYTYAAWNEISFSNYVTANVKIVSHNRVVFIVEYLGPAVNEPVEEFPDENVTAPPDPLRDNFEVFLQTLISQALDPNFLSEITNENDEYFLSNIKEIEQVSEAKKSTLLKDTWDEELQKCANTYPCLNILDSITNEMKCQVCDKENGIKLLQFYGQPYDLTTLGSVEMPLATKTQFNACCRCSATVSLYNRLHHQKYNFFIKCRTKMNEVKGDSEKIESHVLLEDCLQDHAWVNTLYSELEQTWRECEEKS